MSDPGSDLAPGSTTDALTQFIRAAPELRQSPGAAVALTGVGAQPADAQAVGLTLAASNAATAAQQVDSVAPGTTAAVVQHHKAGLFGRILGDVTGAVGTVDHGLGDALQAVGHAAMVPTTWAENQTVGRVFGKPAVGQLNSAAMQVLPGIPQGGTSALQMVNKPMAEVQHEYRYFHDVWARHGATPAILELLGAVGAGVAVDRVSGSAKAGVLGAEAAAGAEGQFLYHDSWQRTANGNAYRDPSTGQNVSPGRDLANALGVKSKGFSHGLVSGTVDGLFDMVTDPVQNAAGVYGQATSKGGLRAGSLGGRIFSGTGVTQPGDWVRVADQYKSVGNALDVMANTSSPSELIRRFPVLAQEPGLAAKLAADSSRAEVLDTLESRTTAEAIADGRNPYIFIGGAPRSTALGEVATSLKDTVRAGPFGKIARSLAVLPTDEYVNLVGESSVPQMQRQLAMYFQPKTADMLLDQWIAHPDDEALRFQIWKSVNANGIMLRAGADMSDETLRAKLSAKLADLMGGEDFAHRPGAYAAGDNADALSKRLLPDGSTINAALLDGQLSQPRFISYGDVKDMVQTLSNHAALFGKASATDDFLWEHITSPWRNLTLLSGAFAMHIAAAEDLLNSLRLGPLKFVDGALTSMRTKYGIDLADRAAEMAARQAVDQGYDIPGVVASELPEVRRFDAARALMKGVVYHSLGAAGIGDASKQDIEALTYMHGLSGGFMVSPEVAADHVTPVEHLQPGETARNVIGNTSLKIQKGMKIGPQYRMFTADDANAKVWLSQHLTMMSKDSVMPKVAQAYGAALTAGLSEQEASSRALQAARDAIDAMPESLKSRYVALRLPHPDNEGADLVSAFANDKVQALKGAVTGADGTLHTDLLASIANGETVRPSALADKLPSSLPSNIPGRDVMPDPTGTIARITEVGHRKVLSPLINFLSRRPAFAAEYLQAYDLYRPLIESGQIDEMDAARYAMQDASTNMLRFIHNPQERLQATETLRNVAPFGFAQVQAYKRFGRLLVEDPSAFRQMQLVMTAMADISHRANGPGGTAIIYPGSGWMTHGMLSAAAALGMQGITSAVPVHFSGNTSSLQAIDPMINGASGIRPSIGPVVSLLAQGVEAFDPHATSLVKAVVGSQTATQSPLDLIIPNTPFRRLSQAVLPGLLGTSGDTQSNDSIFMQTLANLDYQQNKAMTAWKKTDAYKQWMADPTHTEDDANAPGRPNLIPGNNATSDEVQQFVDRVKNQARTLRVIQALMAEITPASPQVVVGNQKLPAELRALITAEGIAKGTQDFLNKYPDATPFTVAMSRINDGGVLSATAKSQSWIDKNYGWVQANPRIASFFVPADPSGAYDQAAYQEQLALGLRIRKAPKEFMNDAYVAAGWNEFEPNYKTHTDEMARLKAAGASTTDEYNNWNTWLASFEKQHPIWADVYESKDSQIQAVGALTELRQALSDPASLPKTPQTAEIQKLLSDYDTHLTGLNPGLSASSAQNREENAKWQAYLKQLKVDEPNLQPVIDKIFRWL